MTDLKSWFPKVKTGGYLCGDDIGTTNLDEHDEDGNVLRIWGKYGTFKACKDFEKY